MIQNHNNIDGLLEHAIPEASDEFTGGIDDNEIDRIAAGRTAES